MDENSLVLFRHMKEPEKKRLIGGRTTLESSDRPELKQQVADYFKRHNLPYEEKFVSLVFAYKNSPRPVGLWAYGEHRAFLNPETIIPDLMVASPCDIQNAVFNAGRGADFGIIEVAGNIGQRIELLNELVERSGRDSYAEVRLYRPLRESDVIQWEMRSMSMWEYLS